MNNTEIINKTLSELKRELDLGALTSVQIVQAFKEAFDNDNTQPVPLKGYIEFFPDAVQQAQAADEQRANGSNKVLLGVPIAVKDNISVNGKLCTCCSNLLQDYKAAYNSTVVQRLLDAGAVILGRTNMDEFAMGSSTEFSCYGPSRNPYDRSRTPGGSSGGSAAVVAGHQAPAALGTETGGSVRLPASYCGLYGLKPTYGLFSRYGVVAFSSSLDQVGLFAKSADDIALLTSVLAGADPNDMTTVDFNAKHFDKLTAYTDEEIAKLSFVLFSEFLEAKGLSDSVKKTFDAVLDWVTSKGAAVRTVSLPMLKSTIDEYYVLTFPEAASNLARFDGIRYGKRAQINTTNIDELYTKTRTVGFGPEVKRRILIGNYVLTQEFVGDIYDVGKKLQALLEAKIDVLMHQYDIILCPTSPTPAFKLGEKVNDPAAMYLSDLFTNFANIARTPSLSVPAGICSDSGLPVGVQFASGKLCEEKILRLALAWERDHGSRG